MTGRLADYGPRLQTKQPLDPRHMGRKREWWCGTKTFRFDELLERYWWVRVGFRCEEVSFVESDAELRTALFKDRKSVV